MSWNSRIRGRVWNLGGNVDTDQIFPGYAMAAPAEKLKDYALAGSEIPDFAGKVQAGDIIVAGENFGCGSSREQAPVALKEAGVGLVIAKSFARIFRRNAINIGLPVLVCDMEQKVKNGQELEVDLTAAEIIICAGGEKVRAARLADNVLQTLEAGGLIAKVRKQLKIS